MIAPDVGGASAQELIYPEEIVALWASKKVERPVKWTPTAPRRSSPTPGRDHLTKAEMAFDKDHRILGCG